MQKSQAGTPENLDELNCFPMKLTSAIAKAGSGGQVCWVGQVGLGAKGAEEDPAGRSRLASGSADKGCTFELVKVLFFILIFLCRSTAGSAHPLAVSQVKSSNTRVVEASIGQHMQVYIIYMGAPSISDLSQESLHLSILETVVGSRANESIVYSYKSFNAFAAKLTVKEMQSIAGTSNVAKYKNK
ncbi:hypothetical protein RJ639_032340 [Escallonia herrerae]|uniref:Inhibitor I9 domain-containing protein n=1 Tax=Escallonia herrerae TaxID=1293975 RepID=A0AA88XAG3_9ASTE|nr:hypothetical protein RJ639_032340 [Escallonia herrerae]